MSQEERLKKVTSDFSSLNEEQQNYILGILQALVFAKNSNSEAATGKTANSEAANSAIATTGKIDS